MTIEQKVEAKIRRELIDNQQRNWTIKYIVSGKVLEKTIWIGTSWRKV